MVRLFTAAALVAAIASPAAAQQVGNYSGTTSDGSGVTFTVGIDPGNSSLAITGASVGFTAICPTGVPNLSTGWGYGLLQDIVANKVTNTTSNNYFYITFNLTFSANGQTASGGVIADSPTLFPLGAKPTKAALCRSARKTMTVTFVPGSAKFTPPPVGALMLGKVQSVQP
jgi:hypothetical protein